MPAPAPQEDKSKSMAQKRRLDWEHTNIRDRENSDDPLLIVGRLAAKHSAGMTGMG